MQSVSQLCERTLNSLLYGVTDLSDETNRQLFIIIQEYILRTKRFQQLPIGNYSLTLRFTNC